MIETVERVVEFPRPQRQMMEWIEEVVQFLQVVHHAEVPMPQFQDDVRQVPMISAALDTDGGEDRRRGSESRSRRPC